MRRALKLGLAGLVLLAATAVGCGYHAAAWLQRDDPPIRADAIVILAGPFTRSMHAADLYRAGYAPVVVLSEPVPEAVWRQLEALDIRVPSVTEIHRRVLGAKGVPAERVEPLGRAALSTADEALQIAERFGEPGRRLVVVTSPSHVRRARMVIADALEGRGVALSVSATPYETFREDWWRSQDAAREVLLETAKLAFYLAGGRYRAASEAK